MSASGDTYGRTFDTAGVAACGCAWARGPHGDVLTECSLHARHSAASARVRQATARADQAEAAARQRLRERIRALQPAEPDPGWEARAANRYQDTKLGEGR